MVETEVENNAWATQWNCMELDNTLAFPPRPCSAEVAAHGSWCRRAEVQRGRGHAWYHRTCAMSLSVEEFGWKSLTFNHRSCCIGLGWWRPAGDPGQAVPLWVLHVSIPHVPHRKAKLWWCGEYVSGATYISSLQAARLVVAEMQDFSNAVQGSWAFQENCQCRPVLFSLSEKWCGGEHKSAG